MVSPSVAQSNGVKRHRALSIAWEAGTQIRCWMVGSGDPTQVLKSGEQRYRADGEGQGVGFVYLIVVFFGLGAAAGRI